MTELSKFLDVVFHDLREDEEIYLSKRYNESGGFKPSNERSMVRAAASGKSALYFCTTSVDIDGDNGYLRRTKQFVKRLHVLVLDDVGEKVDVNALEPTYKIETSPGSQQWGYVFHTAVAPDIAEKLVKCVYANDEGLTDAGGAQITKIVRLPCGINEKKKRAAANGGVPPVVRLVSLDADRMFSVDQLAQAWGLDLDAVHVKNVVSMDPAAPMQPADYERLGDPLMEWLSDHEKIVNMDDPEWVSVKCPWHGKHSMGDGTAGYSALGMGSRPDTRAFHCFHESCADQKTSDFLEWVVEMGGPDLPVFDPVAPMVARYAHIEHGNMVVDLAADAKTPYPITKLAEFKAANQQQVLLSNGEPLRPLVSYGEYWLRDPRTKRIRGAVYRPQQDRLLEIGGHTHLNRYLAPVHEKREGEPVEFLEHMAWILPDPFERELFLDWVAHKLQHPEKRSFAMVMVAAIKIGMEGTSYGIGRSVMGRILGRVFQQGVKNVELDRIVGRGGQGQYNSWLEESQLVIVEESKEQVGQYSRDHEHYEKLKRLVDPGVTEGIEISEKYGRDRKADIYCVFLFLTNHEDAIAIPSDDRRLCCLTNSTERRSEAEYAVMHDMVNDPDMIAQLHTWLMAREIKSESLVYPPMTPAKAKMIQTGESSVEAVWKEAMDLLHGVFVTRQQLIRAVDKVFANEGEEDGKLIAMTHSFVKRQFRKMEELRPNHRLKIEGKLQYVRILKHVENLQDFEDDAASVRFHLRKNDLLDNLTEMGEKISHMA